MNYYKPNTAGQQTRIARPSKAISDTSSSAYHTRPEANHKMVPGTHETHFSHMFFHSDYHLPLNSYPSGGMDDSPARQFTSIIPFPIQNRHSFRSFPPFPPPPDSSPMLTLSPEILPRRSKKLRKPSITRNAPDLPPLSFVEDRDFDTNFEHMFHDVQSPSLLPLRPQSLTHIPLFQQDTYPPDYEPSVQPPPHGGKSMRRRWNSPAPLTQIVPSSSGAAAAAAATGNPAAPVAAISQISSPFTLGAPVRSQSDHGRSLSSSITMKGSNLMRKLSRRSPRPSFEASTGQVMIVDSKSSGTANVPTSSGSPRRWTWWRATVEHNGKDESSANAPLLHPKSKPSKLNEVEKAYKARPYSARKVTRPSSIALSENIDLSMPVASDPKYSRSRPKFTLEANDSEVDLFSQSGTTIPAHYTDYSQSCLPSCTHSVYSPLSLHGQESKSQRRRWTFAMAMMDEELSDEALLEVLERIRLRRGLTGSEDGVDKGWNADLILFGSQEEAPQLDHNTPDLQSSVDLSYSFSLPSLPLPLEYHNPAPTATPRPSQHWRTAQRVLFTCRELVRTERHYFASLQTLLASNTETAPPPLMVKYAEELTRVSELYLGQMQGNPSAWGVAAAFLGAEEAIEGAFVRWCGSVGIWFKDGGYEAQKLESNISHGRKLSKVIKPKLGGGSSEEIREYDEAFPGPLKKVSSWRRSMSSIPDLGTSVSAARKKEKNAAPPLGLSSNGRERQRRSSQVKKLPVRDLAILPTQRIMRYVLLYRDLLDHTPSTSLARPIMKRAADATLRLAKKCDRAQNNSAFILGNSAVLTTSSGPCSGNRISDLEQDFHPL